MRDAEMVREILSQTLTAARRIELRSASIGTPAQFVDTDEGMQRLDSICMLLIAIGESLKRLDRITAGTLLQAYPDYDWKGAKGARDVISHHYFDVNAEAVFQICRREIPRLIIVLEKIIKDVEHGSAS